MAEPNWYVGRQSRFYYGAETGGYAVAPSFSGSSAMRIQKAMLAFDNHKYRKSPVRFTDPGLRALFLGRYDSKFQVDALMFPSGTLNTLPEADGFFKNGFGGSIQNITLATSFTGGGETTTTGTVASATGLAAGQFIRITTAGVTYARRLTVVAGAALTWEPALPVTPADADLVKGCITYPLGTALQYSLDCASYPHAPSASTPAREMLGCVVDKIVITLTGNDEPQISFSGPAQGLAGSTPNWTPQSEPGSWTTVGAEASIPTGTISTFQYGATVYQITKIQIEIVNSMKLHNVALGSASALGFERTGQRMVTVKATAMVSDDKTLWTPSVTAAQAVSAGILQIGNTGGYIWAMEFPSLMITAPPVIPDTDAEQTWDFQMQALAVNGNDECYFGMM